MAVRCLRALIRRDAPMKSAHMEYLLDKTYDSNASMVSTSDPLFSNIRLILSIALRKTPIHPN